MERKNEEVDKESFETEDHNIFQDSVEKPIKFDFYQKDLDNVGHNETNRYGE